MQTLDKPFCEMNDEEVKAFLDARLDYTSAQMADEISRGAPREWLLKLGTALTNAVNDPTRTFGAGGRVKTAN